MIDALKGDQTLFVREDEVETAWRWIDSICASWEQAGTDAHEYPAGSWGPDAAGPFLPPTVPNQGKRR